MNSLSVRSWPRLCDNPKSENPSGKLPTIYYILRLENGLQWFVQVLTRPVMQRYPTCEKIQIVFTQPGPKADKPGCGQGKETKITKKSDNAKVCTN